jgi:hypothetical protein
MCWWYGVCDCEEVDDINMESGDRCCVEVVEGAQKRATEKASSVSMVLCCVAAKHRSDLNKEQQRMSVFFLLSFFIEIFSFSSMIRTGKEEKNKNKNEKILWPFLLNNKDQPKSASGCSSTKSNSLAGPTL